MTVDGRLAAAFQDRYQLEREIGTGGMATVWLAHDVRHDRKVAIKVMHPELAAAIGAERFLAEIRVTANLQHPHILPLHDSGHVPASVDGAAVLYYVMPYVKGESLRDRLQRERQLPLADAVNIARDVAAALDYAHRQGVIHRDIKPENILLHEGRPLVADFGIALALSAAGTARMTQTGLSLGTPHYMSPEQAMGERQLDHRTDIYALGAVLYEMVTGEPPFTGATVQAVVAKVMSERPVPPSTVRDTVPSNVEAAILTALAKLPADRFASASEFSAALGQPTSTLTVSGARRAAAMTPAWRQWASTGIAVGALLLAGVAWATRGSSSSDDEAPVMRFEIPIPDSLRVQRIVLTPDGTRLLLSTDRGAFVYTLADARIAPLEIPGAQRVTDVDVTLDGETLIFREGEAVKTMPFGGGPVRPLNEALLTIRPGDDGYIYGRKWQELRRVSISTGEGEALRMSDSIRTALDSLFGEVGEPVPVPGGRGVVFTINTYAPANTRFAVLDTKTGDVSFIPLPDMAVGQPIGFAPTGHLLFRSSEAIYAVPFDATRLVATGAPEQVVGNVLPSSLSCVASACSGSTMNSRALAYVVSPKPTPALVNRTGGWRSLPNIPPSLAFHGVFVSPDGNTLVAQVQDHAASRQDIWTYSMTSAQLTRLATGGDGFLWSPRWTADGKSVRFASVRKDEEAIYSIPRDASSAPKLVLKRPGGFSYLISHHPDGKRIGTTSCITSVNSRTTIFTSGFQCKAEDWALVLLYPDQPDSVTVIEDSRTNPRVPDFSPDGKYVAFLAREVDRHDVYVRPLDGRDMRWQVSRNGAIQPHWSRDGRTIYFLANDSLFAADWRPDATPPVGTPRALFRLGVLRGSWDVMPGDSTFMMIAPNQAERTRIVVIANYPQLLGRSNRRQPAGR
jgi:tRNA A-37 threonylcarbamoyl transferase component Bud32